MVILALGASCLLVRALPRMRLPHVRSSDTYFHLFCARVIREAGFCLPTRLPRILLAHEHTYPFLYHYLLALLPLRQRLWAERCSGALFDTAALAVILAFMAWLTGRDGATLDPRVPLVVAALFAFSPALLRIGSGPRAYSGNPRPVGQFFYLVHILSAYYAFFTASMPALAVSVLAAAAAIVTAKFSTQVLFFFAPFFAVLVTPWYLALPVLAVVAAILLSGGRAWGVLKGHYRHSEFYLKHLQRIFIHPVARSLRDYGGSVRAQAGQALRRRSIGDALTWYFTEAHPLHLLLTVYTPFLVLPFVAAGAASSGADRFMLAWCLAAAAWFVVTKTRTLMFLGEGERYLEYATFPSLFLAVSFLWSRHPGWVYAFLAYSVVAAAFYLLHFHRQHAISEAGHEDSERAFDALNAMRPGVILPVGSVHWQALYRSNFPVLTIGVNLDETLLRPDEFMLVYGRYPYPSADFAGILSRYGVRYIVSDGPHLRHYVENILDSRQSFYDRVRALFDSPRLVVYEVIPGRSPAVVREASR
jgi:hypothetical protein